MSSDVRVGGLSLDEYSSYMSTYHSAGDTSPSGGGSVGLAFHRLGKFFSSGSWINDAALLGRISDAVSKEEISDIATANKVAKILNELALRLDNRWELEIVTLRDQLSKVGKEDVPQRQIPTVTADRVKTVKSEKTTGKEKEDVKAIMDSFINVQIDRLEKPVFIFNPANNCYINSSLQALFSSEKFLRQARKSFKMDGGSPSDLPKYQKIHGALDVVLDARLSQDVEELTAAVQALRITIADQGIFPDLTEKPTAQQDAAELISVLLETVGLTVPDYTITKVPSVRLEERGTTHRIPVLDIGMVGKTDELQELVNIEFSEDRVFGERGRNNKFREHTEYIRQRQLKSPPEVLVLRLKRGEYSPELGRVFKYLTPYYEPENGILDMSQAFSGQNVRYKIQGVVYHAGEDFTSGHYVSKVKSHEGKSYFIDDLDREQMVVADGAPYGESYLFILEKI